MTLFNLIPAATLIAMMCALGMTVRVDDFKRLLVFPTAVVTGLVGQLALLPALAFAIAWALGLPERHAIGLVLIAACPGGATSNMLSHFARGDVALSISLTAASSLTSFAYVPFLLALGMRAFGGGEAVLDRSLLGLVGTLLGTTALPVALGMWVLAHRPHWAARLQRPLLNGSTAILLLLIGSLVVGSSRSDHDMVALVLAVGPPVVLLIAIATGAGLAAAWALGLNAATGRTLALEIGIQNFNLALVVALTVIGDERYAGAGLIYLPASFLFAAAIIALGRRDRAAAGDDAARPGIATRDAG